MSAYKALGDLNSQMDLYFSLFTIPISIKTKWSYFISWQTWNTLTVINFHLNLHMPPTPNETLCMLRHMTNDTN